MAKGKRKAKDTIMCWGWHSVRGNHLVVDFPGSPTAVSFNLPYSADAKPVRVRVIRESDYRRLLKKAGGK